MVNCTFVLGSKSSLSGVSWAEAGTVLCLVDSESQRNDEAECQLAGKGSRLL